MQDCDKLLSIEGLSADRRALGLMSKASVKLLQEDYLSVIEACTQVAGMVGLSNNQLARAFFLRGIAAQSQGSIEAALDDYERPFTLPENRVFSELGSSMPDFFDSLEMTTGRIVSLLIGLCFDAGVLNLELNDL